MSGGVSDAVNKCIAILKTADGDTEKFASLFMVTKLVKGADCNTESKKLLFEAIGFKFLKRLLLSKDVPSDCPPLMYKSVALSILSSFCSDPVVATHPEMLANIPVFLDIVQQADDDDLDDNLMLISEAYECLQNIAAHDPGQKALLQIGGIEKMCEIYAHQSFQTDEALNVLVMLVERFGPNVWDINPKPFHAIMNKIALDFETDHSERKFELCIIMHSLLSSCRRNVVVATAGDALWPASVYKGLNDILTSKLGKAQRDPALKLASVMVELLGMDWCLSDEENPRKFFLLLVQLSSVEVRMQLEDRTFKQIMGNADLVTACFIILELSIQYIANDTLDLEQKEKQLLYTALKNAFAAVIGLLTKVSNDFKKNPSVLDTREKIFVCAMVRVLSAWLAQETSAMRNAIYTLLPFMLTLANETFYACRSRKLAEKKQGTEVMETDQDAMSQIDILRLMLPALCHLAVEEKARKILFDIKEDEVLYECLAYHWSIVHYKKPVVPKSERGKKREPEPELEQSVLEDMKDSRAAMVSICNIFMNITVLEAKIVEESPLFATLLKFLFNNVPELKSTQENLVLHGNLAVLGLLLLKQQAKKVKKNDFSICRYIQATIRFLWDAYNVDESNNANTLVVTMTYKKYWFELMELWFLGMQTMSAVLALIPWISEFAIESGWAEAIIDMLLKVKSGSLPANTKSAYEDFLCHLVDANNSLVTILHTQYGISKDEATLATQTFLRNFRLCPDNCEMDLDEWRHLLWTQALGTQYINICSEICAIWLKLRYQCLALSSEVTSFLLDLRQHYLLCLITNGPSRSQWEKIQRLQLHQYFDCVLVSGDLPWEKPDRNIFLTACNYLGVQPKNCLMVGDKLETDIQGGIKAALGATVYVSTSNEHPSSLEPHPDYIISNVTDLSCLLPSNPKHSLLSRPLCCSFSAPELEDCSSNSSDGS